ncbi:MAG: hypothetical protein R3C05_04395 [Pirellulaceae bacterium]
MTDVDDTNMESAVAQITEHANGEERFVVRMESPVGMPSTARYDWLSDSYHRLQHHLQNQEIHLRH